VAFPLEDLLIGIVAIESLMRHASAERRQEPIDLV